MSTVLYNVPKMYSMYTAPLTAMLWETFTSAFKQVILCAGKYYYKSGLKTRGPKGPELLT